MRNFNFPPGCIRHHNLNFALQTMNRADAAESKVSDLEREADALDGKSLFT